MPSEPSIQPLSRDARNAPLALVIAGTLVMTMGWGVRGAYGHCTGAMMPGAMLGLVLAVCARRDDWWKRCALLGMLGAIGFAWGGQASYGKLIGYTQTDSLKNGLYGYATLFLVGGLYGSLGAGFLGLGLTQSRSFFARFIVPLTAIYLMWWEISRWGPLSKAAAKVFNYYDPKEPITLFAKGLSIYVPGQWLFDTVWVWAAVALFVAAIVWVVWPYSRPACKFVLLLTSAWFIGMFILVHLCGLRINPPRSDSWGGCVGVLVAFVCWLIAHRNRAALMLTCYGGLAGGIGFAVGDFLQMVGRAKWGPIADYGFLQQFNYWTIMEQFLGLMLGLGTSLGFMRLIRGQLAPPQEDNEHGWTNEFAIFLMLGPMLWDNLYNNTEDWITAGKFARGSDPFPHFRISPENWLGILALLLTVVLLYALIRNRKQPLPLVPASPLGRSQLLALFMMWLILGMYFSMNTVHAVNMTMFMVAATAVSLFVLQTSPPGSLPTNPVRADNRMWSPGIVHWLLWIVAPFLLWGLAATTVKLGLEPKELRFNVAKP